MQLLGELKVDELIVFCRSSNLREVITKAQLNSLDVHDQKQITKENVDPPQHAPYADW